MVDKKIAENKSVIAQKSPLQEAENKSQGAAESEEVIFGDSENCGCFGGESKDAK